MLAILVLLFLSTPALGDTPVTLFESLAGNLNITGTGGTLRTNPDTVNSCTVTNSGSMTLSGIPAGATVTRAYLYWAGSGGDPQGGVGTDYDVTFNGTAVTADRTYTASYDAGGGNVVYFFGGVKDVTSTVQAVGNGVYTFADLTVQNANVAGGGQYCASAAVLSAYSLLVVYDDPTESLHVVNIWEGFQGYRGASITLTPTNFLVPTPAPATALSSRIMIVTWEGDSGNSGALNGFNENLTFCSPAPCAGTALTDAYNPLNNQFNSTVDIPASGPFSGIDTTWGVDMDLYDLTSRIPAGAASAQSVYSSGGDLVILMNQTMAIPNVPVADLAITKTHTGNFTVGANGTYTLGVTNNGPNSAAAPITVIDTLPAGLTYSSASGTGWTCGAVASTVTCTLPTAMASGASAPNIDLTVGVGAAAYPSVTNIASVSGASFDNVSANDTASDPTTVEVPDLSTSTKTWTDLNGGDQDPNDTIRYTITIINTASVPVSGVTATDTLPGTLTSPSVVTCPAGATCGFAGQTLTASNVSVPANGSVTVVFDATIAGGTSPGTTIDNTATITNPSGPGASPAAATIIVSGSSIPQWGNKPLYLYDNTAAYKLSRTKPAGLTGTVTLAKNGSTQAWILNPSLSSAVTTSGSTVSVNLWLGSNRNNQTRTVEVRLSCASATGTYATSGNITLTAPGQITTTPQLSTFTLSGNLPLTCAATDAFRLDVFNRTGGGGTRDLIVYPMSGTDNSYVDLPSRNVINVDSVETYNGVYNTGTVTSTFFAGDTVYLRVVVSDPFGSYDINANPPTTLPKLTLKDPAGSTILNAVDVPQVADSGTLTKTFEYAYGPLPASGPSGTWTATVTASEGTEGTVSDFGVGTFKLVLMPSITMLKVVQTYSDPVSGPSTTAKAVPGSVMLYTTNAVNSGYGTANNFTITDSIPANTELYVGDIVGAGSGPVLFTDGPSLAPPAPSSGLAYTFGGLGDTTDSIVFLDAGGNPMTPNGVTGFDANVRAIRITPAGSFSASDGTNNPAFSLKFRVRIQ